MTVLNVKEMACEHCVKRITDVLTAAGLKFEVNLADKTVSVDGDEAAVKLAISEMDDIGFTAQAAN
ncbi:heavy-metal-associated domain-containing protein [Anaerolentibacter hominis]|uniref:heavy-metal-associated domain-containing protein n=1 Tax=Anaerolentibacter hominis TaxID=3079009 RepID=UPI0031B870A6